MTIKKTLGAIVLAGAMALGISGCPKWIPTYYTQMGEYLCRAEFDYSSEEIKQDRVEIIVGEDLVGFKATCRGCQGDHCLPPVTYGVQRERGDQYWALVYEDGTPDPDSAKTPEVKERCKEVYQLVKQCEQLLEQKYHKDF